MAKFRFIYVFGFLIGIVLIAFVITRIPTSETISPDTPYERWQSHGIDRYEIDILSVAPPAPPSALRLTIAEGNIDNEIIIACEDPSEEDPARLCEPVATWYTYLARHTIDDLFEISNQCRENTRIALDGCSYISGNFQGFESQEEVFRAVEECEVHFHESTNVLCSVRFNETYGYPEEIFTYMPFVNDGVSVITGRDFRPVDR